MDYRQAVAPKKGKKQNVAKKNQHPKKGENSGEAKFREAQLKLQLLVEKHLGDKQDSSSEEEEDLKTENIFGSVIRNYSQYGGRNEDLERTQNFLENVFHSGAAVCLICIATVKRSDQIWSCVSCYGFFHLLCVQRWGKDSIAHQKLAAEDRPGLKRANFQWQCPKCRKDYESSAIPSTYFCFCGQKVNPEFQPWLVPHSCGETCNKELLPECGHRCLLLCHPGPCPPCPKTIDKECYCKKGAKKRLRCSEKDWSCGSVCGRKLACRQHACPQQCHPGDCPPCDKKSLVTCDCGSQTSLKPCTQLQWQCDKVCGKALSCGEHRCERVCHKSDCGPCPQSLPRTCPCGRNTLLLPCTQDILTCGETCSKPCESNGHVCSQRCHRGSCPPCMELLVRTCRCGLHQKEISCHQKMYLCEVKCKRMRDCNVHPCKRKCCDGNCPSCEKPCGKTLSCGHHKCSSVCHRGPCYPCNIVKQISCKCGTTKVTIPCGAERYTNPPKCSKPCKNPPKCDHPVREEHRCHFGDCPPCKLPCGKARDCGHSCSELCHTAVLLPKENYNPATPWDVVNTPYELKRLPCKECPVPVDVSCFGGHEILSLPCYRAKPLSCGKECGRILRCTNHVCTLPCHVVENAPSLKERGSNCDECSEDCSVERECGHACPQPCHPGSCNPCKQIMKMRCHCGVTQLFISCNDWTSSEDNALLQSCGNQCPKNYECGHRCVAQCHAGECPRTAPCRKKVKVTCPCRRIKKDIQCHLACRQLECDDACHKLKVEKQKREEKEREEARLAEERRNQEELERYEKRLHGGKRCRERRRMADSSSDTWAAANFFLIAGISFLIVSFLSAFYFFTL